MAEETNKVVRLEAARGLAAFIVYVAHFLFAFQPQFLAAQVGSLHFVFLNAASAVIFFFVLSGYVLAVKPLQTQSLLELRQALIRRWPRLIPLSLFSVLLSWVIYQSGGYVFPEAAAVSGTDFYSDWEIQSKDPTLWDAILQGSVMVFFSTENYLNRNLWTMVKELQGSVYVFLLCALVMWRAKSSWAVWVLVLALMLGTSRALLPFMLGFVLAYWLPRSELELSKTVRFFLLVTGLYFLGFVAPTGAYAWIGALADSVGVGDRLMLRLPAPIGSVLVLIALLTGPVFAWLEGPLGRKLGAYSFALYVTHVVIILSFSGWHYLTYGAAWLCLNFVLTTMIVLILCHPLSVMDAAWVRWLKNKTQVKYVSQ